MSTKLLITDSFFITDDNVASLEQAGYEVSRLDKPVITEDELIEALQDVAVYIIGGIERTTEKVIASVNSLQAIIFTGVDYDKFIPAAESARKKGIKLLNAPGANAVAVAEFAVGVCIAMQRELFSIGRTGKDKYSTTRSLQGIVVGVIGAGNIGQKIIDMVEPFMPQEIIFYNRSPLGLKSRQASLDDVVTQSDVIFLALPQAAGLMLDESLIKKIKPDTLVVSISPMNVIDIEALYVRLNAGEIRAAIDWPAPDPKFDDLALNVWFHVNSHSAYNTTQAVDAVNNSVTETAIKLLNN